MKMNTASPAADVIGHLQQQFRKNSIGMNDEAYNAGYLRGLERDRSKIDACLATIPTDLGFMLDMDAPDYNEQRQGALIDQFNAARNGEGIALPAGVTTCSILDRAQNFVHLFCVIDEGENICAHVFRYEFKARKLGWAWLTYIKFAKRGTLSKHFGLPDNEDSEGVARILGSHLACALVILLENATAEASKESFVLLLDTGYLKTYEPDSHRGRGEATYTDNPAEAMHFASPQACQDIVLIPSRRYPTRADGKPNLPLSAFKSICIPLQAALDQHRKLAATATATDIETETATSPPKPKAPRVRALPPNAEERALREAIRAERKARGTKQTTELAGVVYVLSNPAWPGYAKIGSALLMNERLSTYQTCCPDGDFIVDYQQQVGDRVLVEKSAQRYLNQQHYRGEWFTLSTEAAWQGVQQVLRMLDQMRKEH